MRNLHSVKSLKHFFEIRAKSMSFEGANPTNNAASNSNFQSPILQTKSSSNASDKEKEKEVTKSSILQGLFIKNSQIIEKSIKQGVGMVTTENSNTETNFPCPTTEEITTECVYNEPIHTDEVSSSDKDPISTVGDLAIPCVSVRPEPPPLPDFLLQTSMPQFTLKARTQSSTNTLNSLNENNYGSTNDLHDKLIKEIHNKSLERSKKDATICLDERGNLIVKASNRAFSNTSQKNQKLHKIKDSATAYSNYNSMKSVAEKIEKLSQSNERPSVKGKNFIKNRAQVTAHNQIYNDRAEILNKLESLMQPRGNTNA